MSRELWYLTRGSGIVATILIVAALVSGALFAARATGAKRKPAWWVDLHNMLGGLALVATVVHIAASWLDTNSGIGIKQVVVPGAANFDSWGITWGVLATYLLFLVVFTTWPRRLKNRRLWLIIHLTSLPATALSLLHSYQSGSDAGGTLFQIGLLGALFVSAYSLLLRLMSLQQTRNL